MTRALAYARRALPRERKRAFHKMWSNVPSAPSHDAVAEALFVPSVPIFPPAWGAEVVSSNIVGYNKVNITTPSLQILGAQFKEVGAGAYDIQDIADGNFAASDRILFFDSGTYMIYTYELSTYDDTWSTDLGPGWTDPVEGTRAVRAIQPGEGFWYDSKSGNTVTFSGEVPKEDSITVTANGVLNIVTIPQPMANVGINDLVFEGVQAGDRLLFFENETYLIYTYELSTYDDTWSTDLGPGWTDPVEGTRATKKIDLNQGFWLDAKGATVKISLP